MYDEGTYRRVLDLDTAMVKVKYYANKVEYVREYFASNFDQVLALKISGNKPAHLNFTIYLDNKYIYHSYVNNKNQIIMDGSCPRLEIYGNDNPQGIQFLAVLDLQISDGAGAVCVLDGRKLRVEGCNSAIILLAASSLFDAPFTQPVDSNRDPKSSSLSIMDLV
ncbi:Alpha-L-fucosidase 2 [Abeliophyllum distichum]|uniref:Alpha-L-fucosidase 2 n=1 Tax=Abeliophyllum distichum TaxID=126358 RepID=A0ABD1V8R4_9LAMI